MIKRNICRFAIGATLLSGCQRAESGGQLAATDSGATFAAAESEGQRPSTKFDDEDPIFWASTGELDTDAFPYVMLAGQPTFEGDIVLDRTGDSVFGVGRVNKGARWPGGVVALTVDQTCLDAGFAEKVTEAAGAWEQGTGVIHFVTRQEEHDYVRVKCLAPEDMGGAGGSSFIGRKGGEQVVRLSTKAPVGTVIHELGHALGLMHEQGRSDRNKHVKIEFGNIPLKFQFNFWVPGVILGFHDLGDYDYDSIMHYSAFAFAKDPTKRTIEAINEDGTLNEDNSLRIGKRKSPSSGDLSAVVAIYHSKD